MSAVNLRADGQGGALRRSPVSRAPACPMACGNGWGGGPRNPGAGRGRGKAGQPLLLSGGVGRDRPLQEASVHLQAVDFEFFQGRIVQIDISNDTCGKGSGHWARRANRGPAGQAHTWTASGKFQKRLPSPERPAPQGALHTLIPPLPSQSPASQRVESASPRLLGLLRARPGWPLSLGLLMGHPVVSASGSSGGCPGWL